MIVRRLTIGWSLLSLLLGEVLIADPVFFRKDIQVSAFVDAVVPGDFDGDGRTDLAVGAQDGLFILLNQGDGNFSRPIHTEAAPRTFWLRAGADFNGDHLDDLVGSGFLYLSRGDGTFLPRSYLGVQEVVGAADFNRDGQTDLVISSNPPDGGVRIFLGNGDGTFRPGAVLTSTTVNGVLVRDFNADGKADLATVSIGVSAITSFEVFLGRGDGTFGAETQTKFTGAVAVADFNGDGLEDLFIWTGHIASRSIMLGAGDGSFRPPIPQTNLVSGYFLTAADFTADGYADVITNQSDRFYLYPGKGDGTLLPPVEQSVGLGLAFTMASSDLDGDGRRDLVSAGGDRISRSGIVSVLLSKREWRPEFRRAVSAAGYTAVVAPESLASLFAPTGAIATESASPPWPMRLGGISLEVRDKMGVVQIAPLLFVSPTQINFQVPSNSPVGEMTLALSNGIETTIVGSMQVEDVAPGLFTMFNSDIPAATGVLVEPDGAQVPVPVFTCLPWPGGWSEFYCDFEPVPLSEAGDRPIYLTFYGTGFRRADPANVTCLLNGMPVPVAYVGPQETPGVDQINVRLLPEVFETVDPLLVEWWGAADVLVTVRVNGSPANAVFTIR